MLYAHTLDWGQYFERMSIVFFGPGQPEPGLFF